MEAVLNQDRPTDDQKAGTPAGFTGGGPVFRFLSIVGVSIYLFSVLVFLLAKRRLTPPCSLKKILAAQFRGRYSAPLVDIVPDSGECYTAHLPEKLISDAEGSSRITVFENGNPLPMARAMHDDIRRLGNGRFSHWGANVFFSASDNTDPRSNGRTYSVTEI